MKLIALLIISACSCLAAIGNFSVLGTTATQALIAYTAPDGNACTIQVSQSSSLTPLSLDVDPGSFANSNSDLSRPSTVTSGLSRMVVLGQRTAQYATAGTYSGVRHYSRALQAYTPYFGKITCPSTGDTLTFTFTTTNIPLGQTYGDPWLSDPSHPGDQPWPEWIGGLTPESFIDPLTGLLQVRVGLRGNNYANWSNVAFGSAFNQGQTTPCDSATPWISPCNVTAGSGNTTVGNSIAPLVIRPFAGAYGTPNYHFGGGYGSSDYGQLWTLDQLKISLTGLINSVTTSFRKLNLCLSLNGGASCASSTQQITMGQTSSVQTVGQDDVTQFGVTPWLLDTNPRLNVQESSTHSGRANVSGSTVTWASPGDLFSLYWATGGYGHIRLSTADDACISPPASTTSTEYAITGFTDGNTLTVSGSPPTGTGLYWCANNFAVMVWRDVAPTDGSTVTLTAANMAFLESYSPGIPDNGTGTACLNTPVSNGLGQSGFLCMFGGLYFIDPDDPTKDAYYGYLGAGNYGITNDWYGCCAMPSGETANIDQAQADLTFYSAGRTPGTPGKLVAIKGVFSPSSITQPLAPYANGQQVQNATVTSTTASSATYSNGLTFTNITPQSTSRTIVDQMATFDPTFLPAYYNNNPISGAWNVDPYSTSQGIFFPAVFSLGGDSPAWLFAIEGSTGNVVGAVNTFNTPKGPVATGQGALTGHGLHAVVETGETGWIDFGGNEFVSITTSLNNAGGIAASGPACSTFGVSGGGDCIAIQMVNAGGSSPYEPYLPADRLIYGVFSGAPGELRTTQLGDTACVIISPATGCSYVNGTNEFMTLVVKNYLTTPGLDVFQRGTYGQERAIANGTAIDLFWESYVSVLPIGATARSQGAGGFWNPMTGCAGSPDPHGDCLVQDTNGSGGHGEWRNGGEAVALNVPDWTTTILAEYGVNIMWPTVYQTIVGDVPGILSLPFANQTPYQVAQVNFTQENPPFAGAYGVPFQPDGAAHPNPAGANSSAYEALRAFDNIAVQGGNYDATFTLDTGQRYKYIPGTVSDADDFYTVSPGVAPINRKLMATGAACGSHPLIDISGPASFLGSTTSDSYKYCQTRNSNECVTGSAVGNVYVNCPGVRYAYCNGVATRGGTPLGIGNDICVGNISKVANSIVQFDLSHTDYAGAYTRNLVSATGRLRMVTGFESNQLLPDNSWLLYRQEFQNYQRQELWMAQVPPYPPVDSVARWTFVPVALTLKPPARLGINNAIVEFGYQEYGSSLLNCTTRNDACIATASTVTPGNQPFYFASENPTGASCVSGCTITIPAISQRILYYQVKYRAANNTVRAASPRTSVVVP